MCCPRSSVLLPHVCQQRHTCVWSLTGFWEFGRALGADLPSSISCRAQGSCARRSGCPLWSLILERQKSPHGSLSHQTVPGEGPQKGPGLVLQGHGGACPCCLPPRAHPASFSPALTWGARDHSPGVWLLVPGHSIQLPLSPLPVAPYLAFMEKLCGHVFESRPG